MNRQDRPLSLFHGLIALELLAIPFAVILECAQILKLRAEEQSAWNGLLLKEKALSLILLTAINVLSTTEYGSLGLLSEREVCPSQD